MPSSEIRLKKCDNPEKQLYILKNHNARGDIMKNNDWINPRINRGALRDVQIIEAGAVSDLRKTFLSTNLSGTQVSDVYTHRMPIQQSNFGLVYP
jgi:hypothetical protein